jgi:multidrug efflux pump subunit AcrA (membrane-fusion protein)
MHPWIKSDKPGKCPICGMDLVPVYEGDAAVAPGTNMIVLSADSVTVVNVKTEPVARRAITHTLHVIGTIQKNSPTAAWFFFNVYERDLPWIKPGETLEVTLPSVPDRTYQAEVQLHGAENFADRTLDEMSDSTKVRAKISTAPVEVPGFEGQAFFNGLHAESHIRAATEEVLAVPRSAVLDNGASVVVYVDNGGGGYTAHTVKLGRIGDTYAEVLTGLAEGDRVVTNGGLLIDAEAQLTSGR